MNMKRKAAITLLCVVFIIALCGCGSKSAVNTIGPWDTSDQQAGAVIEILSTGGLSAFAGFNVDETYQSAKMGVEYYKDGKLVKEEGQGEIALEEASQGIAGFNCVDGTATIGVSANGSTGSASDIQLTDYPVKEGENIAVTSITETRDITDGQKIYLGALSAGSDTIDTSVLDASFDKGSLVGQNWLFYVVFSTKPLE
ncbi:MAG: hypothetical protein IJJ01_06265 [Firmicutes bacterium]|nr:hypothetical protein [Bacillota bacterium]